MACSADDGFPFLFFDASGDEVSGVPGDDGICAFPDSACAGGGTSCCRPAPFATGVWYTYFGFAVLIAQQYFVDRYWKAIQERDPSKLENVGDGKTPRWISDTFLKHVAWIWDCGVWVGVTAVVVVPAVMKPSIQANLSVYNRNVLSGAEAFLVPYKGMFGFVQDIVLVKINYALSTGRKGEVNGLLHLGLAGAIATGFFASGLATVLGLIPPVLLALTNPGSDNDLELYPGCEIIERGGNVSEGIQPFWMIEVWKFLGFEIYLVLAGFMFGALEFNTMGWLMAIGESVFPLIWFTNIGRSKIDPFILLAWGEFAVPYVMVILSILYMVSPLGALIREDTGVNLSIKTLCKSFSSLCQRDSATEDVDGSNNQDQLTPLVEEDGIEVTEASNQVSTTDLLKEGGCLMALDFALNMSSSLATYLALSTDAATAYQLTALDSFLPLYGSAYAFGLQFVIKIIGPIFLGINENETFFKFVRMSVGLSFVLVLIALGTTLPFLRGLALQSGQNACVYAGSTECVPFFTNVFGKNAAGGSFTLFETYNVFSFGVCVDIIFMVCRAVIVVMQDFRYILRSTGVAMACYVVALIVASVAKPFAKEAISYWIAVSVPRVVLIVLFLGRMNVQYRRIVDGQVRGAMRARFKKAVTGFQGNGNEGNDGGETSVEED